ncbi:hypothetical protein [Pseudogemmobacter sonorensis]|uniref:hypothetical protein n=1 Tax=Pseudogemmobacter sonorensis TaxID=2989681 RepID=UPI003690BA1E
MKFLDPDDPFFRSPVARWLTVLFPLGWGGVEIWFGAPWWGAAFIGIGLYAGIRLLGPKAGTGSRGAGGEAGPKDDRSDPPG